MKLRRTCEPCGCVTARKRGGVSISAFIGDFVERHNILPELMAVEAWDLASGDLVFDATMYDASSKSWVRSVEPPQVSQAFSARSSQDVHRNAGISRTSRLDMFLFR